MKFKFLLLTLFLIVSNLSAQQIYFSKAHTESGEPIDAVNRFTIEPSGGSIYILMRDENNNIEDEILYIFIDKKFDNDYKPFDSKTIRNPDKKNWVAYNYEFTDPGEYEIYIVNTAQKRMTSGKLSVRYKKFEPKETEETRASYYRNTNIVFAERVFNGKAFNEKSSLSMSNGGAINVYLSMRRPLNTDRLLVDVWKKEGLDGDYIEYVESKKFKVEPEWLHAFFKYNFRSRGEYKISIHNADEELIGSKTISVQ